MSEKETIYSSKLKSSGIFEFKEFYKFCYDWLMEDAGLFVLEDKYTEKLSGDSKEVEFKWTAFRKVTDYFKFEVKIETKIQGLKDVEVQSDGKKMKMNSGNTEMKIKGTLIRDYDGKFEQSAFQKFLRGIYEKWVIPARIEQFEDELIGYCTEFVEQAKAYLDLEGRQESQVIVG